MKIARLVFLFASVSFASLGNIRAQNSDADFDKLADEFISGYLTARPLHGTQLGLHQYDGKISDYTRLAIDAEIARLKRFDDKLQKFDANELSPRASIDWRILQAAIKKELFEIQDMASYDRNPMVYARALEVDLYVKRDFKPLDERIRDIIAIENQAQNIMTAAKTNLRDVLPKPYVELAIQIANGAADFLEKNFVEAIGQISDQQLRAAFQESNKKAADALKEYANWLSKERLPKATADFALGEEKYRRMLATTELVDLPPAKILEIGLQQLKSEQAAFVDAAKQIDPKKTPTEVFKQIQNEHPTAENLIPDIAKDLDAIRQFVVDHHIVTVPSEVRAQVKETPQYRRATSFASMDTPGAFETRATEAYYYVTPVENNWTQKQKDEWLTSFNYFTADVISIHEAYPGHYVQFLHLNSSPATKTEKIFGSYAFIEGWAHYCEKMMLDEGFGRAANPTPEQKMRATKYRMAQADEALLRVCRLCVSIKMHTQGMSVEDGAKFFRDNCYYEDKPAHSEAMRGTFDPGYLNYTLGKLQILKLRADYKAQEGANFSLEKFHDEMLNHGMPPIRLLREIMLKNKSKWDEVL
jgi:uncharacterized protein (DUF885 family)